MGTGRVRASTLDCSLHFDEDRQVIWDFLRAVCAAAVVLGLPGRPWARVLFCSSDRAERATFTIALSAALVPTTALLLERFFGPGITLPIAAASIGVVFLTGRLANLKFGTGVQPDPPDEPHHVPIDNLTLLLLGVGASFVAAALAGKPGNERAWHILPLIAVAATVWLTVLRRRTAAGAATGAMPACIASVTRRRAAVRRLALPGVLLLVLLRGYLGPALHEWPYIRGVDLYDHAVLANLVLSNGDGSSYMIYPPGFHVLSAVLCRLSGLDPLALYALLAPALLLLPTLSAYVLGRRLFGPAYGLVCASLTGILLNTPVWMLHASTYADLISAEFMFILTFGLLSALITSPSPRTAVLLAILGSAVVLYHSISTLYLALALGLVGVSVLPYLLWKDRKAGRMLLLAMLLLGLMAVYHAWEPYALQRTVGNLLGLTDRGDVQMNAPAAGHASDLVGTQAPHPLSVLASLISEPVVWLGCMGVLLLLPRLRAARSSHSLAVGLFLSWSIILFAGSRTSLSGIPVRMGHALGVPLAVLAGFALVTVARSYNPGRRLSGVATALVLAVVLFGSGSNLYAATRPNSLLIMTPELEAAGEWLRAHNTGGTIITSPVVNAALLAESGYAGLPGLTRYQLDNPRILERRFWGQAREVRGAYADPNGDRARQTLWKYDVRYVALHKYVHAGSHWARRQDKGIIDVRPFRHNRRRYRLVYENDQVVIFEVKG